MFSEVISFLVFAVSLIGLLGFLAVIMTSSPVYRPHPENRKDEEDLTQRR
ncbi:MAG TPA: hypothetical protein VLH08_02255 [Acidobacteriota bacterium]|jgi:hypothetical protein|nr:hypothetical protein [Acidobacteriota bacterium]